MHDWLFVVDVDGVLSTGSMLYAESGKQMKAFGPDDASALRLIRRALDVQCISADHRGYEISRRRVEDDMGLPLEHVSEQQRAKHIQRLALKQRVVFMGDSFTDRPAMKASDLSICPSDGSPLAREVADVVTFATAGERAVASAAIFLNSALNLGLDELSVNDLRTIVTFPAHSRYGT